MHHHYNFHMRNVSYESRLYKMGIKPSDHCNEKESLLHLYWTCPASKRLWERLKTEIKSNLGIVITMSSSNCLLNIDDNHKGMKVDTKRSLRIIYLLCKHYIHLVKCEGEERTQNGLIRVYYKVQNLP